MLNTKSPQEHRKIGNRILFAVAMEIGEEGFDKTPAYVGLLENVLHDSNYKLRIDGVIFLKEYFTSKGDKIAQCERFKDIYLPELLEFL